VSSPEKVERLRLVFADDEAAMRTLIRTLLELVDTVEIVGEAADGEEALRLVQEHDPDLVLLDVQMPRLDGVAAAETIKALRPHTRVVLHSAHPNEALRHRVARLGLPLLDKMRFDDVIEAMAPHEPPTAEGAVPDPRIEAAILSALTARRSQPMFIVLPDGTVPFYNGLAADLLGLPMPPERSDIDSLREHFDILRLDGTPIPVEQRLMYRAIAAHEPLAEAVIVEQGGRRTTTRAAVLPFFGTDGSFVGAAVYFDPVPNGG
jgi:CheY-like chemotaxis protein